jgi:hypothetical protein
MASRAGKRKVLTLEQRVQVVKMLDAGKSCRKVAEEMGCGKTQIQAIAKDKISILDEWEKGGNSDLKYVKRRKTTYEALNQLVWDWFCAARSKNVPISGKMIQEKAIILALEMGHDDFSASNGWLESWKTRHNVKLAVLSGESAGVNEETCQDWTKRLPGLIEGYKPEDIFNADETGLFYRALPSRSMVVKGDPSKGVKQSKERITVLLACSATGEKLQPLVIGHAARPRCFAGRDLATLPVIYRNNKKAWMTASIFKEWLERLNSKMRNEGRSILLLLDNCAAHPNVDLSNVKLLFLPANTTSRLQPCDAGIIQNVKLQYRKSLCREVVSRVDEMSSATDISRSVDILDAIRWLDHAWALVHHTTIAKCFQRCGFEPSQDKHQDTEQDSSQAPSQDEPPSEIASLLGDVSWQSYLDCDDDVATTSTAAKDWEDQIIARARDGTVAEAEADAEDEPEDQDQEAESTRPKVSYSQAFDYLRVLMDFAVQHRDPDMFQSLSTVHRSVVNHSLQKQTCLSQKKIKDFFM